MRKTLLEQVLDFEANKEIYNTEEREKIRKHLNERLKTKLSKISSSIFTALDDINKL